MNELLEKMILINVQAIKALIRVGAEKSEAIAKVREWSTLGATSWNKVLEQVEKI